MCSYRLLWPLSLPSEICFHKIKNQINMGINRSLHISRSKAWRYLQTGLFLMPFADHIFDFFLFHSVYTLKLFLGNAPKPHLSYILLLQPTLFLSARTELFWIIKPLFYNVKLKLMPDTGLECIICKNFQMLIVHKKTFWNQSWSLRINFV